MSNVIRLDNRFIQQAAYGDILFTLREWRIFAQAVARVKIGDDANTQYYIDVHDLCNWMGLSEKRRNNLIDIKRYIFGHFKGKGHNVIKSMYVYDPNKKKQFAFEDVQLINIGVETETDKETGIEKLLKDPLVTYHFPLTMCMFLTNMQSYQIQPPYTCAYPETFTQLSGALACKLYLYFKSYRTYPGHKITLDENTLRRLLFGSDLGKNQSMSRILAKHEDADKGKNGKTKRDGILTEAVEDINEHTDIKIVVKVNKRGSRFQSIEFTIEENEDVKCFKASPHSDCRHDVDQRKKHRLKGQVNPDMDMEEIEELQKAYPTKWIYDAIDELISEGGNRKQYLYIIKCLDQSREHYKILCDC